MRLHERERQLEMNLKTLQNSLKDAKEEVCARIFFCFSSELNSQLLFFSNLRIFLR